MICFDSDALRVYINFDIEKGLKYIVFILYFMNYKIFLIFTMTVITLFFAVYSTSEFAINEKSNSTLRTAFPVLSAYNNRSTIINNSDLQSTANLKDSQQ